MKCAARRLLRGAAAGSLAVPASSSTWRNEPQRDHQPSAQLIFRTRAQQMSRVLDCSEAIPAERPSAEVFDIYGRWRGTRFPIYSSEEVSMNNGQDGRPLWVSHADGVYDVGDFLRVHPGAELLRQASGLSVEELWSSFRVHLRDDVLKRLEEMRVGVLHEDDRKEYTSLPEPFNDEPMRSPELRVISQKPFDAEPHPFALARSFLTPNSVFYVRNHFPVPPGPSDLEESAHMLQVRIAGKSGVPGCGLSLSATELRSKFEEVQICATLMCTGGLARRVTGHATDGDNQISTATWTGARLRDVLSAAGVTPITDRPDHRHLIMRGTDGFEVSVPLAMVWQRGDNILLAYSMNGEELPRDHGWPLRALIPGVVGVRSVKWLYHLEVTDEESTSPWQQRLYRIWPQSVKRLEDKVFDQSAPACYDIPVVSAILNPQDGERVIAKRIDGKSFSFTVSGWAFSGGGRQIVRVEVSGDGGVTWHPCMLKQGDVSSSWGRCWAWKLWTAEVALPGNGVGEQELELQARAVDDSYSHQPEDQATDWNLSGYLISSRPRARVRVVTGF